jgi:hypothetical protein
VYGATPIKRRKCEYSMFSFIKYNDYQVIDLKYLSV